MRIILPAPLVAKLKTWSGLLNPNWFLVCTRACDNKILESVAYKPQFFFVWMVFLVYNPTAQFFILNEMISMISMVPGIELPLSGGIGVLFRAMMWMLRKVTEPPRVQHCDHRWQPFG